MAAKYLYNLYDGDKVILENVKLAEIKEFTGLKSLRIKDYMKNNSLICGKFRVEISCEYHGMSEEEKRKSGYSRFKKSVFTKEMYKEWETMNKRYGKRRTNG